MMASSGSVFSDTLQTITNTKLEELAKQRAVYEQQYTALLAAVEAEQSPLERLLVLVDGVKTCLSVKTFKPTGKEGGRLGRVIPGGTGYSRLETDLKNVDRFLEQARYDPSVSTKVLQSWEKCLLRYLSVQSNKYEYADLYGKLVTEWLSSEKTTAPSDAGPSESFEELPTPDKLESRKSWEKTVFEAADVDTEVLDNYLQQVFNKEDKAMSKSLEVLRNKVEQFELTLTDSAPFDTSTLRWLIPGLQASDLLSNEKREVLKDFLTNDIILAEIADVLNMRMAALDRWAWGDHVPLEQRRHVNGTFTIHMHEDLLQAIFLHYIGVKWSVFFKQTLSEFHKSCWNPGHSTISKVERHRRQYYLGYGGTTKYPNLVDARAKTHRDRYFLHQLLNTEVQRIETQEGEEEAEMGFSITQEEYKDPAPIPQMQQTAMRYGSVPHAHAAQSAQRLVGSSRPKQTARKSVAHAPIPSDSEEDYDTKPAKNPMAAKQRILHILTTEIIINTQLHGELTCFRSVFESFNPSLPHETILAVLKFFGVTEKWAKFFKTFLQAPLKFVEDGPAAARLRRRGTPGSHALSDVFGELTLFCLDFSVNQSTGGGMLHRLYDDFWFWSHDYAKCVKAWSSVQQFTKVMGVELSNSRTGSARIGKNATSKVEEGALPIGRIRWGFLYLDPSSGRFEIDQNMVDSHIEELRKQLQSKTQSVMDWIQTWNSYAAAFFSSNFGKPANCFGREHVSKVLATHRNIQESIFEGGNVVQFVKELIKERFSVQDVPDGFLFFPVELGGLDLKSPFINLLQIHQSVKDNPYDLMDKFLEDEKDVYAKYKQSFEEGLSDSDDDPDEWKPTEDADKFFPYEEFVRHREEYAGLGNAVLVRVYRELLKKPVEESVDVSIRVKETLGQLQGQSNLRGITPNWDSMDAYWKWIAQMYGPEMLEKFGGLNVVDPGMLPTGMVSVFRQKRIKWQG